MATFWWFDLWVSLLWHSAEPDWITCNGPAVVLQAFTVDRFLHGTSLSRPVVEPAHRLLALVLRWPEHMSDNMQYPPSVQCNYQDVI
eukprot:4701507-Amphidinium_carterae.1